MMSGWCSWCGFVRGIGEVVCRLGCLDSLGGECGFLVYLGDKGKRLLWVFGDDNFIILPVYGFLQLRGNNEAGRETDAGQFFEGGFEFLHAVRDVAVCLPFQAEIVRKEFAGFALV